MSSVEEIVTKAATVEGWMSVGELTWLAQTAADKNIVVEIGSWKGRSTKALSACPGIVYAVDHWKGSAGDATYPEAQKIGQSAMFEIFRENLSEEIASGKVVPVMADSEEALGRVLALLGGQKADMVFIDADHKYDSVRKDIQLWRQVLSDTGVLCGHDYQQGAPGVKRAVHELVPAFKIGHGSIWSVRNDETLCMKVLVTGGLGYVGSVVSKLLIEKGHDVLIVDDGRSSIAEGHFDPGIIVNSAIADLPLGRIQDFSPDVAMHFAASAIVHEGEKDPAGYLENNVLQFSRFLDTLIKSGCRNFINSGSTTVYGILPGDFADENTPTLPVSWYGWTKLIVEQYLSRMAKLNGIRYVGFRYANPAGAGFGIAEERKTQTRLIPSIFASLKSGIPVSVCGTDYATRDGTCVRDYVHVLDVAEAHLFSALGLRGNALSAEFVNLGSSKGSTVLEIIREVEEVSGQKVSWSPGPRRSGDAAINVVSGKRATALFGWEPRRTLKDIVRDAWGVYGKQG